LLEDTQIQVDGHISHDTANLLCINSYHDESQLNV